jgi:hypothetical protein
MEPDTRDLKRAEEQDRRALGSFYRRSKGSKGGVRLDGSVAADCGWNLALPDPSRAPEPTAFITARLVGDALPRVLNPGRRHFLDLGQRETWPYRPPVLCHRIWLSIGW